MANLNDDAWAQVQALSDHYERIGRFEAADRLLEAVGVALLQADHRTGREHRAPAGYDELARPGLVWFKVHRYGFGYIVEAGEAIVSFVFYDQADIPRRFNP